MTTADALRLPRGTLTHADLVHTPDDGRRYELIDGVLVVSPQAATRHQRVVGNLTAILRDACPRELEVFGNPVSVVLDPGNVLVPDILVVRPETLSEKDLPTAPVLAIEVLSLSTWRFDVGAKRDRLREAGCAHYWIVDPGLRSAPPFVTAWCLADGAYVVAGEASGEQELVVGLPFPVRIVPQRLVER